MNRAQFGEMESGATTNIVASMVQTRSIERVLAPIAAQVSQLIILNESAEREGGKLPNLVPFAQQVLRATEDLGQVGQTLVHQSKDEVLCSEMPKACDRMKSTGRNVLMAVQRLQAEPHSSEAKENMVTAARRLLQATVKVLLVSDGAEVRRIIQAAHYVLDRLRLVKSVESMKNLVTSFKAFTESVMMLSSLCDRRQQDLTQPLSKEQILVAMDSLRKSVPTLSAAMQTSVKYLNNPQAKASRDYVINQVSSTVSDLISLMERQLQEGLSASRDKEEEEKGDCKEEAGHFASNLDKLIRLLSPKHRSSLEPDFYCHLEDVVRHSMAVGSLSRENLQEQIISSCKQILKQRSTIHDQSEGINDNPDFKQLRSDYDQTCEYLAKELLVLEKLVKYAILGLTVDAFVETSEPLDRMVKAATLTLKEKGPLREKDCNRILQPLEETFHEHADRMCQLGSFIAGSCTDFSQANALLHIVRSLERLDPEVFPACLAVRQDILDKGAVQHLKLIRREWQNEVHRLVEAVDEHIDANRFMEISESYIEEDLKECQQAEVITDRDLLAEAANNLLGRAKRVLQVAYNQVETSDDPIFRNGLKVHVSQLEQANNLIKNAAQKALSHFQHKRAHQQLTERGLHLLECVHKVGQAVIGRDHPDILNPLRESVRSEQTPKAEDFPTYGDEGRTSPRRLHFSKESFLSKPLPASAGVLASDPTLILEDEMSTLHLSKHSPATKKKAKPLKLSYPMAGLVRALFTTEQDPRRVGRLCVEAENKSLFLASLAAKASDCTGDSQLKGRIDAQVLRLISQTSTLTKQSKMAVGGTDSAKMEINLLAEAWTLSVIDIGSTLKEIIGCWGLPGNRLMEESLGGATESLPREIDELNLHVQKVRHLIQGITEASQAGFNLNQSKMATSSTQIQLLHKGASDWTKLTHSLISAANETVINPGEPVLEDLIARRWLDWSVKQRQLISIIDAFNMEMSHVTGSLETVVTEGSHDYVTEHVQRVTDYALKIGHMVNTLASCTPDLASHDSLQEGSESLNRLTNLLAEAVVSCSRVRTDEPSSERKNRSLQRVALLQREWSAKAQLLITLIDQIAGEMTIPLDRLSGAAMAVSQASGPSRLELLDEFQTQSDHLTSTVSGIRQACAMALKSAQAGPLRTGVFTAVDALCRLTPIAVTQARNVADNLTMSRADVGSVKREWACNAWAVIAGLNSIPDALSSAVKDVTIALRCSKQMSASIFRSTGSAYEESLRPLDMNGLSPLQVNLLQTLPKQGTTSGFAPRHHSTPSALASGLRPSPASPIRLPQWRAALRGSSSSRHSSPGGQPRETEEDEQDGTKQMSPTKTWTPKEGEDQRSLYRSRSLGLRELQKTPVQRSATSTPTFPTPRMDIEGSFLNHTYSKCSTSIAAAALVLQQEVEKWEDETNSVVRVAKTISAQMYDMARFARRVNDQAAKDEMINTSKAIAANGRVIFRFAEIISKYCLNERVGSDLRYCAENIPSFCTQLSIIASVKTATPNDDTTDIVLMKNADNLMQAVLNTLKATEAACVKGLRAAPGGNKDEEEATALAMQWRLKLDHHRQHEASYGEVDALGLRRLSRNSSAPALSQILIPR